MTNTLNDPRVTSSYGGGMYPEQHWGTLTDGSVFYFRMRHGWAELHVGPPGTNEGDVPRVNPLWNREEAQRAHQQGHQYHMFWMEPVGEDHAYPDEEFAGLFDSQEDRDASFTRCLDQIWADGKVNYP
jgi:hypothetical protein